MKNSSIFGILTLTLALMPSHFGWAMNFEVHPGIYTAFEYSDNYFGRSHDIQSESTYEVGPSLGLRWQTPIFSFDLASRLAKSLHRKFHEDDSTEAEIASHATLSRTHQKVGLIYEYLQTRWRGSLAEPPGLLRRNTGGANYAWEMTQKATLSLGYAYTDYNWREPHEDEKTQDGNINLTYLLTPRNTIDLAYRYEYYDYQISQDVRVLNTNLAWLYAVTSRLHLGFTSRYTKEERGDLPNEDIYDLSALGRFSITENTRFSATGGQSWLVMEQQDRQSIYIMSASLEHAFDQDKLAVDVSRGYTAEFTTNLYGIYDTKTALLTGEKVLLRTLKGVVQIAIEKTKPTAGTVGEKETDTVARASLIWDPIEYVTATAIYEHLQHENEISDTVRENRYRMVVEARY